MTIKKVLTLGLLLRIMVMPWAYHDDVITNYWWGKFAVEFPLRGYYDWLNFGGYTKPDQPMLYILLYKFIRISYLQIYNVFWFLNTHIPLFPSKFMQWYFLHGNQILEKVPIIISDIVLCYLLYKLVQKYYGPKKAIKAAIVLAFFPPLIYNSAVWGGNDSLLNLLGLSSVYFFYRKKNFMGTILITLCLLFKTSLSIFLPIITIILLKNKPSVKTLISLILISATLLYLFSLPFSTYNPLIWSYNLYFQKILPGALPQITSNAFNFWAVIYGLVPKNDDAMLLNFISIRLLSLIICLILYIVSLKKLYQNFSFNSVILSLATITMITFTFMTRMHERYSFPALIPLLYLAITQRKYLPLFILLSITHLLNIYNLWWIPSMAPVIYLLKNSYTIMLLSLVNIYITYKLLFINEK